jgi:Protein of unknown function (DUF1203)
VHGAYIASSGEFESMKRRYIEGELSNHDAPTTVRCLMNSFRLVGLPSAHFSHLFALSDAELSAHNARRIFATKKPGYPCRVSLTDADIGEELLLLPYEHQAANSPYKSSGPIFVRKAALTPQLEAGVVPDYVRTRLISVRAYDAGHLMTDALVCEGSGTGAAIHAMFSREDVSYIHLHNANRGCFSCAVVRN